MLELPLRYLAIVLSLIVAMGFVLFVIDDVGQASDDTVTKVEFPEYQRADPTSAGELERERRNGQVREWIDDGNDVLLKPFAGIAHSDSQWVERGVPTLFGLLVYGFLLGYLARFARGHG
ncbi:MAG: hypothetical protein ACRDLS_02150 [Solirubrobacteraceae bacterium]